MATETRHKINRFPDRHRYTEIQRDSPMLAGSAGYLFKAIRDIRLGALVKFHVRIDGKTVAAFHADSPPLTIRLHKAAVDRKSITFANGAVD